MSEKQDRQGVRTAAQLEQKWKFGESFAEVMGIATDARKAAEEAQALIEAGMTQEQIFNILTNNGQSQGLYRGEDGELYINASYIKSGSLIADLIKTGVLTSKDGLTKFDLDTGEIVCHDSGGRKVIIKNGTISVTETDGSDMITIADGFVMFYDYDGKLVGSIHGYSGKLVVDCDQVTSATINPGKNTLYSGSVDIDTSFTVPNTADYDLFAIRLGDDLAVLAYKVGNKIYGTSGWAGTPDIPKELYFVSINFSGNTWTLVDACKQAMTAGGGLGTATSLSLTQVIGVI